MVGRRPRHDRRLPRCLRHDHLPYLPVIHEWEYHASRLSTWAREARASVVFGIAGDRVLRMRFLRGSFARAFLDTTDSAAGFRGDRDRAGLDHRLRANRLFIELG